MNCPVCMNSELELVDIDSGLSAGVCNNCVGNWISLQSYQLWQEFSDHDEAVEPRDRMPRTNVRNDRARICPRCEKILTKYRIDVDSALNIDRCTVCSGVWLDASVWENLKSKNLHYKLERIFTDHWQQAIKLDDTVEALAGSNREKFGEENFELVRNFKKWVFEQENPDEILNYLSDYSPLQM